MRDLMVVNDLQQGLIDEITEALKDIKTVKASGEDAIGFTGYKQNLPVIVNDDETSDQFFPYFIVRIIDGDREAEMGLRYVSVAVIIGVHDDCPQNDGHETVMTAITRIINRFDWEPTLHGERMAFRNDDMGTKWALQDEDTYPYFFGAVELKFYTPIIGRREPFNGYSKNPKI